MNKAAIVAVVVVILVVGYGAAQVVPLQNVQRIFANFMGSTSSSANQTTQTVQTTAVRTFTSASATSAVSNSVIAEVNNGLILPLNPRSVLGEYESNAAAAASKYGGAPQYFDDSVQTVTQNTNGNYYSTSNGVVWNWQSEATAATIIPNVPFFAQCSVQGIQGANLVLNDCVVEFTYNDYCNAMIDGVRILNDTYTVTGSSNSGYSIILTAAIQNPSNVPLNVTVSGNNVNWNQNLVTLLPPTSVTIVSRSASINGPQYVTPSSTFSFRPVSGYYLTFCTLQANATSIAQP